MKVPNIQNFNSKFNKEINSITNNLVPPPPLPPITPVESSGTAYNLQNFKIEKNSVLLNKFSLPPPPTPPILASFDSPYPEGGK